MFRERSEGFLALPTQVEASHTMAQVIGGVLRSQDIEPVLPTDVGPGTSYAEDIRSAIRRAEVVVADLTGSSPSVFYEVGLAFGLGKPVLLLSQGRADDLPFDLKAYQIARYRPDDTETVRRYTELWLRDVLRQRRGTSAA